VTAIIHGEHEAPSSQSIKYESAVSMLQLIPSRCIPGFLQGVFPDLVLVPQPDFSQLHATGYLVPTDRLTTRLNLAPPQDYQAGASRFEITYQRCMWTRLGSRLPKAVRGLAEMRYKMQRSRGATPY
jgi:hypothetical protein